MSEWPTYASYACEQLGYEDYNERLRQFTNHWGSLEIPAFVRVLKEGADEDVLLALFALGSPGQPWTKELLIPYVHSSQPMERWAAVLGLAELQEETVLPILLELLTAFFPPEEKPAFLGDDLWLYNGYRNRALRILAEWAKPETIPALFAAAQAYFQVEQAIPEQIDFARRSWRWSQGKAMYALGWKGRFDLIPSFDVPEATRFNWIVCMAAGFIHAHQYYPRWQTRSWRFQPGLKEQVKSVLNEQLGLSEEEQEQYIRVYEALRW